MTNDLETLDDWNAYLQCCCAMPACPVPLRVCESMERRTTSNEGPDTQYDEDLAQWITDRDTWVNELQAEWEVGRDAWLAEDDERVEEDYDVDPPEPRNEEDYEVAEPKKPEGYDENAHGSWAQFSEPAIADDADLPMIYRRHKVSAFMQGEVETNEEYFSGMHGEYYMLDDATTTNGVNYYITSSQFAHFARTYSNEPNALGGLDTNGLATYTPAGDSTGCDVTTNAGGYPVPGYTLDATIFGTEPYIPPGFLDDPAAVWVMVTPGSLECTPSTKMETGDVEELVYGSEITAPDCGSAPWEGGTPGVDVGDSPSLGQESSWADLTRTQPSQGQLLSSPLTKEEFLVLNNSEFPEWPETPEGSSCVATRELIWPKKRDAFIGGVDEVVADPDADPPVEGVEGVAAAWAPCDSTETPITVLGDTTARKVRFWWQIDPQISFGPVTEEDPTPDPISWWTGTTFTVTWQTCFFPKAWTEWKSLYDQYLIDKAAFDDWEDEGEDGPPQPEEPTHPGEQPEPRPTLSEDFTDTWTGPLLLADLEDEDALRFPGGPHVLDAPETEGELRVVNIRFYCYPDSPYGYLPQVTGEAYEDFEAEPVPEPEDP